MGIRIGDNNKISKSEIVESNGENSEKKSSSFLYIIITLLVTIVGGVIVGLILGGLGL
ncbi:hypothetical protein [Vallitalea guaymasensis]|uniref:Uncharacterized protein n=1 Tax=Vallitalea guaymasensis TaxID=1185412 RepID=A0A8J8SAZ2_9FIRM|nr:hypothetical protein [Vallitalea guaymasensis]QUH28208.1 hypothetical protein HYG85_04475 [Vallitalea guaymasensis]